MRMRVLVAAAARALVGSVAQAATPAAAADNGQAAFRELYKELVETNTAHSVGSCTLAAERMAARLKAAGYPDADLHLFAPEGAPKDGGLVAVLHGTDPKAKAILLLAHIDVVEAKREDWTRDPFTLIEEGGYFYARGASDDKAQAAIFTDSMIRYRKDGYHPKRGIKLALTCGEEGGGGPNGAAWLAEHERALIDAEFALNEGAGGELDANGKPVSHDVLAAEKTSQSYVLEVTNAGGHSSRPVPDNAIYHLVRAVDAISRYEFPVQLDDANRGYFTAMAGIVGGEKGAAMKAVVANPQDKAAVAVLDQDPSWHAMLRTTCVATRLDAGHAENALPQRARATINCRIFPGVSRESVRDQLAKLSADPAVNVMMPPGRGASPPPPPLTPMVMKPVEALSQKMWPGVPVVTLLQPGATDGTHLNAAGIPTYGISGIFSDPDLGHIHGLNERIRVKSVYEGRDFLFQLVKIYADH
jgi:acetylornithine deacetylase/succinyl-diaminopimelate desuccinylase-like protein